MYNFAILSQVYKYKITFIERGKIKWKIKTSRKIPNSIVQHEFSNFKIGQKVLVRIKDFENWFESLAGKKVPIDKIVNKFKN